MESDYFFALFLGSDIYGFFSRSSVFLGRFFCRPFSQNRTFFLPFFIGQLRFFSFGFFRRFFVALFFPGIELFFSPDSYGFFLPGFFPRSPGFFDGRWKHIFLSSREEIEIYGFDLLMCAE